MQYTVVIPPQLPCAGRHFLEERNYRVITAPDAEAASAARACRDCDAVIIMNAVCGDGFFGSLPRLRVISCCSADAGRIDTAAAAGLGIQVTAAPHAAANAAAELTIAMLLACAKHIPFLDRSVRSSQTPGRHWAGMQEVSGKTLALIGLGRVGRMTAKKAQDGLEMRVIAYDRYLGPGGLPRDTEWAGSMEEAAEQADFLSLHIPVTAETRGCIGRSLLGRMRDTAWLISCAGPDLLQEDDLCTALTENWIAGAAAGAEEQDLCPGSPLLVPDNLILCPHGAALTGSTLETMSLHAAQGVDEVLQGRTPTWPANSLPG